MKCHHQAGSGLSAVQDDRRRGEGKRREMYVIEDETDMSGEITEKIIDEESEIMRRRKKRE